MAKKEAQIANTAALSTRVCIYRVQVLYQHDVPNDCPIPCTTSSSCDDEWRCCLECRWYTTCLQGNGKAPNTHTY